MTTSSIVQSLPQKLRYWRCVQCTRINQLNDNRCIACLLEPHFDGVIRPQLVALCQTFGNRDSLWRTLPAHAFQFCALRQAQTNLLYRIDIAPAQSGAVPQQFRQGILRLFNKRITSSLPRLLSIYQCFAAHRIGTSVIAQFDIGQIEMFIVGRTLTDGDLQRNNTFWPTMARMLSQIHALQPYAFNGGQSELVTTLQSNIQTAAQLFDQQIAKLSTIEKWRFMLKDNGVNGSEFGEVIRRELQYLVAKIENGGAFCSELVFCHNDYHSGNMIKHEQKEDEEDKDNNDKATLTMKVIDYDYCSYNYRVFDFGNYFNELMIDNYVDVEPFFAIDYHKNYPSLEYREAFVAEYMKQQQGSQPTEQELKAYLIGVEYGAMLSHLWWSVWGIIESQSTGIQFNHIEYARQRLQLYFQIKNTLSKL